jgi:hypothetical protein
MNNTNLRFQSKISEILEQQLLRENDLISYANFVDAIFFWDCNYLEYSDLTKEQQNYLYNLYKLITA